MIAFVLYDSMDEVIYNSKPEDIATLSVSEGALSVQDLTIDVRPRGSVMFTFKKDMSDFTSNPATRAAVREYTFDEIKYVNITVAQLLNSGNVTNPTRFEMLPTKFSQQFDEEDEYNDNEGYRISLLSCDSLLSLPAANYRITSYELYDESKVLLEANTSPKRQEFSP